MSALILRELAERVVHVFLEGDQHECKMPEKAGQKGIPFSFRPPITSQSRDADF